MAVRYKTQKISLNLPTEIYDWIKEKGWKEDLTTSQIIRKVLKEMMEEEAK